MLKFVLAAALFSLANLPAQKASYTTFGTGSAKLTSLGVPKLGTSFQLTIKVPGPRPVLFGDLLIYGFSTKRWGPFLLPKSLGEFLTPAISGDRLLVSAQVLVMMSAWTVKVDIPNDRTLLGLRFYNQAIVGHYIFHPNCPPYWIPCWIPKGHASSNGGAGVVGT